MRKVKRAVRGAVGRPARISREAIVGAARQIVESGGLEALTMRRVADELNVVPMAIYRHVGDKNELLVHLLDAAYDEVPKPRFPKPPRARLAALWRFLHGGLARYPWVVEAIVRSDVMAPAVLPQMEAILKASLDCGLTTAQAGNAYRIVWQYTVGELMLRSAMLQRVNAARPSTVVQTLLNRDASAMPTLAAVARYWFTPPSVLTYEEGLQLVLDGVLVTGTKRA